MSAAKGGAAPSSEKAPGPVGAAATTPQKDEGAQAEATVKIAIAMKMLSMALAPFGSDSEKGDALMKSISSLQRTFGVKLDEADKLIPAELKVLIESANMKSPEEQALAAQSGGGGAQPPMKMAA